MGEPFDSTLYGDDSFINHAQVLKYLEDFSCKNELIPFIEVIYEISAS